MWPSKLNHSSSEMPITKSYDTFKSDKVGNYSMKLSNKIEAIENKQRPGE